MELANLMSGIGVVIDDKIQGGRDEEGEQDLIVEIVERISQQWNLAFYTTNSMPNTNTWAGLLRSASFVMLDWRLWPRGASQLEEEGIEQNVEFLRCAIKNFVPVFVFTNENRSDVVEHLPAEVLQEGSPVFIKVKNEILRDGAIDFSSIEEWMRRSASVYALKVWESTFYSARRDLFASLYSMSASWPRVFWKAYEDDGIDPGSSLMNLISDNLRARMLTGGYEADVIMSTEGRVSADELRSLIGQTVFQSADVLPDSEIYCGDLFLRPRGKVLLNIRADCDCIPREGVEAGDVELFCVEGKFMGPADVERSHVSGEFPEKIWESIVFAVYEGRSIRFDFRRFSIVKYSEVAGSRIGRLLHPHRTRVQQRFGLFLQRQGLPRVPDGAVPPAS